MDTFEVKTGYGYFKDKDGHIIAKYDLPKGNHPKSEGYTYHEVATKEEMEAIGVYVPPETPEQIRERKIQTEMGSILRNQAISNLRTRGEID